MTLLPHAYGNALRETFDNGLSLVTVTGVVCVWLRPDNACWTTPQQLTVGGGTAASLLAAARNFTQVTKDATRFIPMFIPIA